MLKTLWVPFLVAAAFSQPCDAFVSPTPHLFWEVASHLHATEESIAEQVAATAEKTDGDAILSLPMFIDEAERLRRRPDHREAILGLQEWPRRRPGVPVSLLYL